MAAYVSLIKEHVLSKHSECVYFVSLSGCIYITLLRSMFSSIFNDFIAYTKTH